MAKTNKTPKAEDNAELRTISLLKILNTYSDENHELSTKNIMDKLQKECGVTVHRTTVGKNIKQLADCGFDIYTHKTTQNRYYLASRLFEMPELKLLADAVESAGFITEKKSEELIERLCWRDFARTTGNPATRAFTILQTQSTRLLRSGRKLHFTIFITVRARTVC